MFEEINKIYAIRIQIIKLVYWLKTNANFQKKYTTQRLPTLLGFAMLWIENPLGITQRIVVYSILNSCIEVAFLLTCLNLS